MGIYIKGMEMPKVCYDCDFCTYGFCSQINRYVTDSYSREEDCPIIELPPHGRLIDADALTRRILEEHDKFGAMNQYDSGLRAGYRASSKAVRLAPTIIPAEGKED